VTRSALVQLVTRSALVQLVTRSALVQLVTRSALVQLRTMPGLPTTSQPAGIADLVGSHQRCRSARAETAGKEQPS